MKISHSLRQFLALSLLASLFGCDLAGDVLAEARKPKVKDVTSSGAAKPASASSSASKSGAQTGSGAAKKNPSDKGAKPEKVILQNLPLHLKLTADPISLQGQVVFAGGETQDTGIEWEVDNPEVAKIADGKLIPLKTGQVQVTGKVTDAPELYQSMYVNITDKDVPGTVAGPMPTVSASGAPGSPNSIVPTTTKQLQGDLTDIVSLGSKLFVSDKATNKVHVYNIPTRAVDAEVVVSSVPIAMSLSPDKTKLYVASNGTAAVDVIDTSTYQVLEKISTDDLAFDVAATNNKLFVSMGDKKSPIVIDLATKTKIADLPADVKGEDIEVAPDGSSLYVRRFNYDYKTQANLWKIDVSSNKPTILLSNEEKDRYWYYLEKGSNIALSPDGSRLFVPIYEGSSEYKGNYVKVLNTSDFKPAGQLDTQYWPESIAVSPDNKYVYVSFDDYYYSYYNNRGAVQVFDAQSLAYIKDKHFTGAITQPVVSADGQKAFGVRASFYRCWWYYSRCNRKNTELDTLVELFDVKELVTANSPNADLIGK